MGRKFVLLQPSPCSLAPDAVTLTQAPQHDPDGAEVGESTERKGSDGLSSLLLGTVTGRSPQPRSSPGEPGAERHVAAPSPARLNGDKSPTPVLSPSIIFGSEDGGGGQSAPGEQGTL